jgi:hypothetical protein
LAAGLGEVHGADARDLRVGHEERPAVGRQAAGLGERRRVEVAVDDVLLARPGPDADDLFSRSSFQIWCGPAIAMARTLVPGIRSTSQGLFSAVVRAGPKPLRRDDCWPFPATVDTARAFRSNGADRVVLGIGDVQDVADLSTSPAGG